MCVLPRKKIFALPGARLQQDGSASAGRSALFISVLIFLLSPVLLFSQKRDSLYETNKNKIIIIKNNKFKYYNNWINAGAGEANDFTRYGPQFTLGADYNFHIRAEYFQLGFFFSGDKFGSYNNFNYHLGYGRRRENNFIHYAAFAGLAYSTGYKNVNGKYDPDKVYNELGLYACVQFIKKVTYDTGIGPSLFFDINPYQFLGGLRLDIYFSGAYRGKVKGTGE